MFNRSRLENTPQKDEHILRPRDMKVWSAVALLVVHWLRICLSVQGMLVRSLVGELRSHMLWGN